MMRNADVSDQAEKGRNGQKWGLRSVLPTLDTLITSLVILFFTFLKLKMVSDSNAQKNVSKCISVYRLNNTQRRRKLPQLKSIIITLKALMTGREVALNTKLF